MVSQIKNGNDAQCIRVAIFDNIFAPTYNSQVESFTFDYDNGDNYGCDGNRQWVPTFECDQTTDWRVGEVTEGAEDGCHYYVLIKTKYACQDQIQSCTPAKPS